MGKRVHSDAVAEGQGAPLIDGLKQYPEMRDTGLAWLPRAPAHWELHRAKFSFRESDERSLAGDEELCSVSHKTGVTPRSQKNVTMFMAESYAGHKLCRPGDIVVNTMWAWMAAIGVSGHVGIVSPSYGVYRPRPTSQFEGRFLDYLLRTEAYRAEFLRSSRGVTTSRLRLYPPDFLNIPLLQPPLEEQRAIVRFLDWHGSLTAKLIRAKRRLIALLNEQKQAIVHRAVTRGLDPNARLVPSGDPWIGDIPEPWSVTSLGALLKPRSERNRTDLPLLSVVRERGVILRAGMSREENHNFVPDDLSNYKVCRRGDFVINKMKAWQGSLGIAPCDGIVSPAYFVYEPSFPNSEFAEMLLRSRLYVAFFARASDGVRIGQWDLSVQQMKRIPVVLPTPGEQEALLAHVRENTSNIERMLACERRDLDLLDEYRARVIAAIVTGQLDVHDVASTVPEIEPLELEADPSAAEDDLDSDTEGDVEEAA